MITWIFNGLVAAAMFPLALWYFHWLNWFEEIAEAKNPKVLGPFRPFEIYNDLLARLTGRDVIIGIALIAGGTISLGLILLAVSTVTICWLYKYVFKDLSKVVFWDFTKKD